MSVDYDKIKQVIQQLNADMKTDPDLRAAFANNRVRVLTQRGLNQDEIIAWTEQGSPGIDDA
jgi:hypothetical protein